MKKHLVALLVACLLIAGPVLAGNVIVKEVMNTTFDDSTVSDTTEDLSIQGYDKVAFFVNYDETEVGGPNVHVALSLDLSCPGTISYVPADFSDFAGDSQVSEDLTTDGTYYFWLAEEIVTPYARVKAVAEHTNANDLANVRIYLIGKK